MRRIRRAAGGKTRRAPRSLWALFRGTRSHWSRSRPTLSPEVLEAPAGHAGTPFGCEAATAGCNVASGSVCSATIQARTAALAGFLCQSAVAGGGGGSSTRRTLLGIGKFTILPSRIKAPAWATLRMLAWTACSLPINSAVRLIHRGQDLPCPPTYHDDLAASVPLTSVPLTARVI